MDEASKAKATMIETGAINITITNAEKCKNGWTLCVDGGNPQKYFSKTAAIGNLIAGSHIIKVQKESADKRGLAAEKAVNIVPGTMINVEFTLS